MLRFNKTIRKIIKPPMGCDTLRCGKCSGVEFRAFVEPRLVYANVRELACIKCGAIIELHAGKLIGKKSDDLAPFKEFKQES